MGEVYKARDPRLDRTVAVKVLPQHMSSSAEVRQRFEREAKMISQLSHAHICALYDVGREGDTEYLVMEYLEGETLSDRLAKGALPVEQALRYGQEIADALDKAHRQGIVHRDLKPGNVMITKSGVKLLDFGLAKAMTAPSPQSSLTSLPTQHNLTQEGTILGTFQYMAPEQLEGKDADARTDIFAFGAVLYEMATGRKAFEGASRASLISAILRDEPRPIAEIQPMAPATLDRLVRKSLRKDPEDRWQSARDVATELEWIREGASGSAGAAPSARPRRPLAPWIVAAALAAAVVAQLILGRGPTRPVFAGALRFEVPPAGSGPLALSGVLGSSFALSPDGRRVAFMATSPAATGAWNGAQLFVRSFDAPAPEPIAGTEGAHSPFWSPDGTSLAFFADGKLKKISLPGGPPVTVCAAAYGSTGAWGREGTILFSDWEGAGPGTLSRVPASGGQPAAATRLDESRHEHWQLWPVFLPDGRRFLYLSGAGDEWPKDRRGIYLGVLGSSGARLVAPVESEFALSAPGFLLFAREGALFELRFDLDSAVPRGEPMPIAPVIEYYGPTGMASLSASEQAPMLAFSEGPPPSRLVWADRTGKELGTVREADLYRSPRLSPDGRRLAFALVDRKLGTLDLWVEDLGRNTATRITSGPASEAYPVWSPDGRRVVFSADRGGAPPDLFQVDLADQKTESLLSAKSAKFPADVSPDGRSLLYTEAEKDGIWMLPLTGQKKPVAWLAENAGGAPRFSPDGRFVAYVSSESGRSEVYVRPFPGPGERWQVSRSGGERPVWSPNGRELYFLEQGRLMASAVRSDHGFESSTPVPLFEADFRVGFGGERDYDVAPDGRFLLLLTVPESRRRGIQVIANWASGLKS